MQVHSTLPLPARIGQIDSLQVLRAVAVFLVAWFHVGLMLSPQTPPLLQEVPSFGTFGIDIFFVISGFILSVVLLRSRQQNGPRAAFHFLKRRLVRIFPIYWIFALLTYLRLWRSHKSLPEFHLYMAFLLPSHTYPDILSLVDFSWTLTFEVFFYLVLAAILLVTVRKAPHLAVALLVVVTLAGTAIDIRRPILIVILNPILIEFVFGCILALCYQRFGTRRVLGIAMVVAGTVLAFYLAWRRLPVANGMQMVLANQGVWGRDATWGLAAALIVSGVVFWSPPVRGRLGRLGLILGNASYSTYLASGLVQEYANRALFPKPPPPGFESTVPALLLHQTVLVVTVFLCGWACYQFVEWPIIRKLQAKLL
jgi:exopolysaccharide production protein ExoZ